MRELQPVPADTLKHFATIGLAWLDRLPTVGDAIHKAVHPSLALSDQGVWRPTDPVLQPAYPDGLTLTEALGLTAVVRWAERCEVREWSPVSPVSGYGLWIEGDGWCETNEAERLKVATAWLTLRRVMRPPVPWGPRDPVAEDLQCAIRSASARLSPAVVTTIHPETIDSDVGRDWSGGYGRSP